MKIAHVIATFPPDPGGMGRVAHDECLELARAGHLVTVFCLRYAGTNYFNDDLPFKIVRLRPVIKAGDAGLVPQLFFKLKNFDLVHLHYPWYGAAEWVWLVKILRKQNYAATYHMDAAPAGLFKRAVRSVYDFFLAGAILEGAAKIFAVDAAHFKNSKFGKKIPAAKVVELANAVDLDTFKPGVAKRASLLFVGNFLPVKRLDLLLKVIAGLEEVSLTIVGGGYADEKYKRDVKSFGLERRIKFVGRICNPEELSKYYHEAIATVIPSDAESSSLVALEAMASGCPVIASGLPAIANKISDGIEGFLFKAGSSDDLRGAIKKFLAMSDEEKIFMGARGRQKVINEYSLDDHCRKLQSEYFKIAGA